MKHTHPGPLQPGPRPALQGTPNPTCPILLEAKIVLEKTNDLHRAIRKLRRSTQRCVTCPDNAECPTMRQFAHSLDTAIRELRMEWGLDKE